MAGALAFHWALLIIVLRHLRLLVDPVQEVITRLASLDACFQIGTPELYLTDAVVLTAGLYLLLRRWRDPIVRYLSQFGYYFALLHLLGIASTGVLMRYWLRVDLVAVKRLGVKWILGG